MRLTKAAVGRSKVNHAALCSPLTWGVICIASEGGTTAHIRLSGLAVSLLAYILEIVVCYNSYAAKFV